LKDIGNGLPYAVTELNDAAIWCDVHHGTFFMFRNGELHNVGASIATHFFDDVTTDSTWLARTWSYVDRANGEVAWVYRSSTEATGKFDKAVVFDYVREVWYTKGIEGVTAYGRVNRLAKTIDELTGMVDAQTGVGDLLEVTTKKQGALYGLPLGTVAREEVSADLAATLLTQDQPVLETGDLLYGSAQQVKTVSAITINATGTTFNGVQVEVSARERIDDAVSYTVVGTWTESLAQRMLTFAPKAGKVLRYRFKPVTPVRGFVFRGYEDNVSNTGAHR
jgi:hypothetical protein